MCAIVGALMHGLQNDFKFNLANRILSHIMSLSTERGRDGKGYALNTSARPFDLQVYRDPTRCESDGVVKQLDYITAHANNAVFISNLRAEPTTEYVKDKTPLDQQPYVVHPWMMVHNGTIANDKELRTRALKTKIDSAAIVEQLAATDQEVGQDLYDSFWHFYTTVRRLKGSFAIIANNLEQNDQLHVAANYRPIWYIETEVGVFFASSREYLPEEYPSRMVTPYTVMNFHYDGDQLIKTTVPLRDDSGKRQKALVVCSGGLDSVVSATYAQRKLGYEIELIHFQYGSRAEGPEVDAVKACAEFLGVPLKLFPLPVYQKGDSPLLDSDSKVAGGEAGAEFAHEWVPARNLLLLSVATAYAEANGFEVIVLGNNLEEAGAYPDNEPEFIARFNDLLPFAVGDGKLMEVIMPVGNLMKHEIVKLGHDIGAPMDLTWSCYRANALHCGTCGPCFMRRTAFEINNLPEVIHYAV